MGEHKGRSSRHKDHWPMEPHYEFLADSIWQDFAYGRNAVYPQGHHGNALLSKFPIISWNNHDISLNRFEQRGLLHCKLDLVESSQPLHAVCVHLNLREAEDRKSTRLNSSHVAISYA